MRKCMRNERISKKVPKMQENRYVCVFALNAKTHTYKNQYVILYLLNFLDIVDWSVFSLFESSVPFL